MAVSVVIGGETLLDKGLFLPTDVSFACELFGNGEGLLSVSVPTGLLELTTDLRSAVFDAELGDVTGLGCDFEELPTEFEFGTILSLRI